ncbi:hypothetical protein JI666_14920 [Bacillus sp. NTK071]|uniref:hypothetical protein n=1 Tax=Bacillus sp. NTK071 TaxID=2802175 RepID=UPI001A90ADAC|nr:hypothetical protein [Bacillus sp. NTK071]MBN8210046.1 hypothetical protein [Bacillus sp. NTK071]
MMWITHSHMKLPRPYLVLLRNVVSIAVQDLKQSKSLLHSKGIRVYIENTKDEIVVCTVYCRGYNQTYRYTSVQIRNQVERRIAAYFLADSRIQKRNSRSV